MGSKRVINENKVCRRENAQKEWTFNSTSKKDLFKKEAVMSENALDGGFSDYEKEWSKIGASQYLTFDLPHGLVQTLN